MFLTSSSKVAADLLSGGFPYCDQLIRSKFGKNNTGKKTDTAKVHDNVFQHVFEDLIVIKSAISENVNSKF